MILALACVTGHAAATPPSTPSTQAEITALYPNPVAYGDAGEFVTVTFPTATDTTGWTINNDAGAAVRLPAGTHTGTVTFALSSPPDAAPGSVATVSGHMHLTNDGDVITLRTATGRTVDTVRYGRAPEADLYRPEEGWEPLGATAFDPAVHPNATVTSFLLPDAPEVVASTLADAEDRLLLGGYTLTSQRVSAALIDAHRRGVTVDVVLEGEPVGGVTERQVRVLDRLTAAGVSVTVIDGPHARYQNHHPKYAVVDDSALVLTENWKPAGVGGRSSRGWGVLVHAAPFADALAEIHAADTDYRDGIAWTAHRETLTPVAAAPANDTFSSRFSPERTHDSRVKLLVTPDNADTELRRLLAGAQESIYIQQVGVDPEFSLLNETLTAARRGVTVRLLLSSAWYAEADNRQLATDLERLATREQLDLDVRLIDPRSRFAKSHTKGIIVDERHVVVGSLNWNPTALYDNREVMVQVTDPAVGGYFTAAFEADWHGGQSGLPYSFAGAIALAWIGTGTFLVRRLRWGTPVDTDETPRLSL